MRMVHLKMPLKSKKFLLKRLNVNQINQIWVEAEIYLKYEQMLEEYHLLDIIHEISVEIEAIENKIIFMYIQ